MLIKEFAKHPKWNKVDILAGLKAYAANNEYKLVGSTDVPYGSPRMQAYGVKAMLMSLDKTTSNITSGTRLPKFLKDLVDVRMKALNKDALEPATRTIKQERVKREPEQATKTESPGVSQRKVRRLRYLKSTGSVMSEVSSRTPARTASESDDQASTGQSDSAREPDKHEGTIKQEEAEPLADVPRRYLYEGVA